MKIRALVIGAVVGLGGFAGCLGSGSTGSDSQLSFDFASSDDRAKFAANDLQYEGTVGPYAVYRVTGPNPSLTGPHVAMPSGGGVSVIMGAKNYFVTSQASAPMALLNLTLGGHAKCGMPSAPQGDGSCTSGSQGSSGSDSADGGESSDTDGGAPPVFSSPDGGSAGWGSGCHSGGGSGSGGWGSGGGGGGYGGGGGGYGGGGGGGGGYSNPGGYGGGGWNNSGCGDGGTSGGSTGGSSGGSMGGSSGGSSGGSTGGSSSGSSGGMNGGGDSSGGGTGGASGSGGSGGGNSDSDGGPVVGVSFQSPPPVGSTVLLRQVIVSGPSVRAATPAPGICCSAGQCNLSTSGSIQ